MPEIRSLNIKNVSKAMDNHTKLKRGNEKLSKVFSGVIKYMSFGIRNFTYKDLCDVTGLDTGEVRYYFNKLVAVGAIKLED